MTRLELLFSLLLIGWSSFYSNVTIAEDTSSNPPVAHSSNSARQEPTDKSEGSKHNSDTPPKEPSVSLNTQQNESRYLKEDGSREASDTQQERMWPLTATWAAFYVAVVSAFATSIYAVISWWQWRALRTQNRPWIMVTPDKPEGWPSADTGSCTFRLRWSVENVGKSPAFLTQLWANVVVLPYPVPYRRLGYGEDRDFGEFIIRPNGSHCHEEDRILSEPDVMRIQTGEKCLVFYGLVDYRDTFNTTHRTRFCSYWIQEGDKVHFSPVGPRSYIEHT